jgi:hypothetical protein
VSQSGGEGVASVVQCVCNSGQCVSVSESEGEGVVSVVQCVCNAGQCV